MEAELAGGDAQRVWFAEMLQALVATWSPSMTWDGMAAFCQRMTEERKAIRQSRGIQPPRIWCPTCQAFSQADIAGVTIRSALFSLKKAGVVDETGFAALDKSWRKHKRQNQLDSYGRRLEPAAVPSCHGSGPDD